MFDLVSYDYIWKYPFCSNELVQLALTLGEGVHAAMLLIPHNDLLWCLFFSSRNGGFPSRHSTSHVKIYNVSSHYYHIMLWIFSHLILGKISETKGKNWGEIYNGYLQPIKSEKRKENDRYGMQRVVRLPDTVSIHTDFLPLWFLQPIIGIASAKMEKSVLETKKKKKMTFLRGFLQVFCTEMYITMDGKRKQLFESAYCMSSLQLCDVL